MTKQEAILEESNKTIIPHHGSRLLAVTRGEGSKLWDADGNEYIDLFPGFGSTVVGHCHPKIVEAISSQARKLCVHGNLFINEPAIELGHAITHRAFGGKVFFCHGGSDANEAALKLVRRSAGDGRYKIISFHGCFHGRTMGSLSLTPESFQTGFEPMLPGNVKATYGDLESVKAVIDGETAGVFVEPFQMEGGLNIPTKEFMRGLRQLCDEYNLLLVCDEVWTAPARTGTWFGYHHFGIEPDVMTLAKAIGGGAPVGVCVASPKYADVLGPGTHASTTGGNPLCAAAGLAAMKLIEEEGLVERAGMLGRRALEQLRAADIPSAVDIRGVGALVGVQLEESRPAADVFRTCMQRGVLVCTAQKNVVRIAPALTIEEDMLHKGIEILVSVMKS